MRPHVDLFSLPNRTTFIFTLIFILCLGIFLPALPASFPAWGFLLIIVPLTVHIWLNRYERMRRRWQARDLHHTHPRLAQHIRTLMNDHAMRHPAACLDLWWTADPRAMIHMEGTLYRHALIIWDRLADELQTACTQPVDPPNKAAADQGYVQMVLDQELEHLQSFWQRYPQALFHSLTGWYRRAQQAWHPRSLDETHPQLASKLRSTAQHQGMASALELWCTSTAAAPIYSARTIQRAVILVAHETADALSQALQRPDKHPAISRGQADALLLHELAHLRQRDLPLVSLAHAMTYALGLTAGLYLFGNALLALFLLQVPAALNSLIEVGETYAPALIEAADLSGSDNVYQFDWTIAGKQAQGIGLLQDDRLAVGVGCSVAFYQVLPDGSLEGYWSGGREVGTERADPIDPAPSGTLATTYALTGTNPDDAPYDGTLTLEQHGAVYHLSWQIGDTVFSGVGLFQDDTLAVGWGQRQTCGVIAYQVRPDGSLTGLWAEYGSDRVRPVELVPVQEGTR
jgi:hypothetical protein